MREKIFCKNCGKTLAFVEGFVIYLYCKSCKKEKKISIKDLEAQITNIIQ